MLHYVTLSHAVKLMISWVVELPGHFCVWLASAEAKFLKGKFVWANWDVPELLRRAEEIRDSRLLTIGLAGVAM